MPANLMEPKNGKDSDELLRAQTLLWSHIFNHIDSMSLKCAVELGIPDAIAGRGPSITITELMSSLQLSPSKTRHMRRLMRMLTHSGFFACSGGGSSGLEDAYSLTPLSELLVAKKTGAGLSGFLRAMLDPIQVDPFRSMSGWFRGDEATPFSVTHGCGLWDMTERNPEFNEVFNEGMASDTQFLMDPLLKECGRVFHGLESLMDVGGGTGSVAMAIAKAFHEVKCSVLELPQVVDAVNDKGNIEFIAGDMFDYIPPANAVLLKWILHDWNDEECVKILQKCKEAIPSKEDGGKVIIIDLVVVEDDCADRKLMRTQLYWDMMMMVLCGGIERGEEEWKKLFMEAGFADYKITPVGLRSVIEVYP